MIGFLREIKVLPSSNILKLRLIHHCIHFNGLIEYYISNWFCLFDINARFFFQQRILLQNFLSFRMPGSILFLSLLFLFESIEFQSWLRPSHLLRSLDITIGVDFLSGVYLNLQGIRFASFLKPYLRLKSIRLRICLSVTFFGEQRFLLLPFDCLFCLQLNLQVFLSLNNLSSGQQFGLMIDRHQSIAHSAVDGDNEALNQICFFV